MDGVSTIGPGTVVRGSVHGDGDLEIQGRVEGNVTVRGELTVAEGALLRCDVSGRRVVVRGTIAGNVSAIESIVIEAGARVAGDIGAPQIGIRPGALVRGNVATGAPLALGAAVSVAAPAQRGHKPAVSAARSAPTIPAKAAAVARAATPARTAPARAVPAPRPAPRMEPVRMEPPPRAVIEASPSTPGLDIEDVASLEDEEGADQGEQEQDLAGGGPPPPVVPAIRKGAKAQLRRKGAR